MSAVARAPARLALRRAWASDDFRWGAGIVVGALILRIAFVVLFGRTKVGFNDTFFYQLVADSLAHGHGYTFGGHQTVHWPPGYGFLLGGVYAVFGSSMVNALLLNAVLGSATVGTVYLVALRVFGRTTAIAAALGVAVMPGQLIIGNVALSETLYTLMLVGFIALATLLEWRPRTVVLLGVLAGLAALTRGEGFLFPVMVLAMWWWRGLRRQAILRALAVAAVMLVTVAPWTIRNAVVVHAFVPVATNASDTLWSGHNSSAQGGPVYAPHTLLLKARGANFELAEANLLRREALKFAVHHPLRELKLIPLKLAALSRGDSFLIDTWLNTRGQHAIEPGTATVVGVIADLASEALMVATILAVVLFRRSLWRIPMMRGVLVFLALAIPLYGFVYYGNVRYHVPLEPLMLLVIAPALGAAWAARERFLPKSEQAA